MKPVEMKHERERLGWTQQVAASRLGVSQPYLSLLEAGSRRVPAKLGKKVVQLYGTPATALPLDESFDPPKLPAAQVLAEDLAGLGYPGFSHLRSKHLHNPAAVLFNALGRKDLESRLVEALPWVVLRYPKLNWEWLVPRAQLYCLQNRLGYVTHLAYQKAKNDNGDYSAAPLLAQQQSVLENARLAVEGTLCHDSLSSAERSWLREVRPPEAAHWNLLTDLRPEQLRYATA
jgi:transcriptional regulator with XRE-family HTH domain